VPGRFQPKKRGWSVCWKMRFFSIFFGPNLKMLIQYVSISWNIGKWNNYLCLMLGRAFTTGDSQPKLGL
jgi:hypothetical protein